MGTSRRDIGCKGKKMGTIDTIGSGAESTRTYSVSAATAREALAALARRLVRWSEKRRTRRALLALNDTELKDIGISRADAHREGTKTFWR